MGRRWCGTPRPDAPFPPLSGTHRAHFGPHSVLMVRIFLWPGPMGPPESTHGWQFGILLQARSPILLRPPEDTASTMALLASVWTTPLKKLSGCATRWLLSGPPRL